MSKMIRAKYLSAYEHLIVDQLERAFRAAERRAAAQQERHEHQNADVIPATENHLTQD